MIGQLAADRDVSDSIAELNGVEKKHERNANR